MANTHRLNGCLNYVATSYVHYRNPLMLSKKISRLHNVAVTRARWGRGTGCKQGMSRDYDKYNAHKIKRHC